MAKYDYDKQQEARQEVVEVLNVSTDREYIADIFSMLLMKWYHQGAIDALDKSIVRFNVKPPAEERP